MAKIKVENLVTVKKELEDEDDLQNSWHIPGSDTLGPYHAFMAVKKEPGISTNEETCDDGTATEQNGVENLVTVKVELEDEDDLQNSWHIPGSDTLGSGIPGSHHAFMAVKMEPGISTDDQTGDEDSTTRQNGGNMVDVKMEQVDNINITGKDNLADTTSLNGDNITRDVSGWIADNGQQSNRVPTTLEDTLVDEPDGTVKGNMVTVKMEPVDDVNIRKAEDPVDTTSLNGGDNCGGKFNEYLCICVISENRSQ